MVSKRSFLTASVFLIILANLPLKIRCQNDWSCIPNSDAYITNGTYHSNLNTILATLPTIITSNGFYNASLGRDPDTVHATALCRADVQLEACRDCVQNSTIDLPNLCPNTRQAIRWNLNCTVRYSNVPIMGIMSTTPAQEPHSPENVATSSPVVFREDLRILLNDIRNSAAYRGNSSYKVAAGTRPSANVTISGLAQCTPDLSPNACNSCLADAVDRAPVCCGLSRGARILRPSCILRFEDYLFYDEARLPQLVSLDAPLPVPTSPLPPHLPPRPPVTSRAGPDAWAWATAQGALGLWAPILICFLYIYY